ncbi:MAG: hypothetical protein WB020_00675, partial [Candidatus Dormiibacterota bacterium]
MGRDPLDRGFGGLDDAALLTPQVAWQALIAEREEGNSSALESLRPWLTASATQMVHDHQLAALVAQQVLVDLSARTGQAIRSPEELEQWLKVRLTQTAALFTGSAWIGTGVAPAISSSIPSALALSAGWRLAAWTRQLVPRWTFRPSNAFVTSFAGVLAVALVASALASGYSLGSGPPPPGPNRPTTVGSPGGVPYVIAPVVLAKPRAVAPPLPAPAPAVTPFKVETSPVLTTLVQTPPSPPTVTPPPTGPPPRRPPPY